MKQVNEEKGACTFYTEKKLIDEIHKIANKESRNLSSQMTYIIRKFLESYED